MGTSYRVELKDDELEYEEALFYNPERHATVTPSAEDWAAFEQSLSEIGVSHWLERYPNCGTCDGTQWGLYYESDNIRVVSSGNNIYPKADGTASNDSSPSKSFTRFCRVRFHFAASQSVNSNDFSRIFESTYDLVQNLWHP